MILRNFMQKVITLLNRNEWNVAIIAISSTNRPETRMDLVYLVWFLLLYFFSVFYKRTRRVFVELFNGNPDGGSCKLLTPYWRTTLRTQTDFSVLYVKLHLGLDDSLQCVNHTTFGHTSSYSSAFNFCFPFYY